MQIYQVFNGPPGSPVGKSLGFVYLKLYKERLTATHIERANASFLCKGHVFLGIDMPKPPLGQNKLMSPDECITIVHELGHAVHMLCFPGNCREFQALPLDVKELPSVLVETLATHPSAVLQYGKHYSSGSTPPSSFLGLTLRQVFFYQTLLQRTNVTLGIHSPSFDPHNATPEDVRVTTVKLWQKYASVVPHPSFSGLSDESCTYLAQGPEHLGYLLCYLRAHGILENRIGKPQRSEDNMRKWLSPPFAANLREQLLDQAFAPERDLALLPNSNLTPPSHPLPSMSARKNSIFRNTAQWAIL